MDRDVSVVSSRTLNSLSPFALQIRKPLAPSTPVHWKVTGELTPFSPSTGDSNVAAALLQAMMVNVACGDAFLHSAKFVTTYHSTAVPGSMSCTNVTSLVRPSSVNGLESDYAHTSY